MARGAIRSLPGLAGKEFTSIQDGPTRAPVKGRKAIPADGSFTLEFEVGGGAVLLQEASSSESR